MGEGPGSNACQLQPLRFSGLGKKSLALLWRRLCLTGLCSLEDILGGSASWHVPGKKAGESHRARQGSGQFAQKERGRGKWQDGRCLTQYFECYYAKLGGISTLLPYVLIEANQIK